MTDENTTRHDAPTRRALLKYGLAAGSTALLAGCSDNAGSDVSSETTTSTETTTSDPDSTSTTRATDTQTATDPSYTVEMSPVGEVTFESVPESIFTRLTHHAGMAFALGRGDDVNAMHAPGYYNRLWNQITPRLPGVELDWSGLYSSWQASKEKLYELDSDIHLADPAWIVQLSSWSMADIEEVREQIGPWFGNSLSDTHQTPPESYADSYQYYGLWEQFEKVANVFKETARYEALAEIHTDLLSTIEADLPVSDERPAAVMLASTNLEEDIYAYSLSTPGFLTAHTRPLGPTDAFEGSVESGSTVDFETMLEADPDVILLLAGFQPSASMADARSVLESDPVASEITAVQNDRVHAQGARYQGPILNLFQLEMTAKQLYPDAFGEWPTYVEGPYPEIPEDEQLFDRQRVADIINGDF